MHVLHDDTPRLNRNTATNIVRLSRAIARNDPSGMAQIVHYDTGLGTEAGMDGLIGAIYGDGLELKLRNLYTFLALNYDDGDEVYLFGFGRGALMIRSLASFIYEVGLVRRRYLRFVADALAMYRRHPGASSQTATAFREAYGDRIPIKLVACFDTVAALDLNVNPSSTEKVENGRKTFHNATITPDVEHAIHVAAIDEERAGTQHE